MTTAVTRTAGITMYGRRRNLSRLRKKPGGASSTYRTTRGGGMRPPRTTGGMKSSGGRRIAMKTVDALESGGTPLSQMLTASTQGVHYSIDRRLGFGLAYADSRAAFQQVR